MGYSDKITGKIQNVLNQSMVQMSITGGILFFILASTHMLDFVKKNSENVLSSLGLNVRLEGNTLIFFHSIIFAVLFYLSITFILEPLLKQL